MISLQQIRSIDHQRMWDRICSFDEQWRDAIDHTSGLQLNLDIDRIRDVLITGMGGAVIGGQIIRAISLEQGHLPVEVNRSYNLPSYVSEHTLVVAVSQSGNTEETLSAFETAGVRGAQRLAISTGGELEQICKREQLPFIGLPERRIARAALAYTFVALWRVFQELNVFLPGDAVLMETADFLEEEIEILSNLNDNEAVVMASELKDTLPIIYAHDGLMEPVSVRWKTQFNENAKMLAFRGLLPEMNHNEIEGWELTAHLMGKLSVIMLQDVSDHPRVHRRMEVTKDLVEPHAVSYQSVSSTGSNALERIFYMILYGDFVSFYLAIHSNVDPMPIVKIELLKKMLNELDT